jgi:hypothetical protein
VNGVPFEQFTVSVEVASVLLVVPVVMLAKLMFVALIEQLAITCTVTSKLALPVAAGADPIRPVPNKEAIIMTLDLIFIRLP